MSHALGKPSTHGRPDPTLRKKREVVGGSEQNGAKPTTARESDPLIVLRDGNAEHTGKGRTVRWSLHRKH